MVSHHVRSSTEHDWRLTIEGRFDGATAALKNMSVDHGGLHVFVTEQLLNSANIRSALQQMCCKAVPKRVNAGMFGDASIADRFADRAL
jgi:hypothetical protein